MILKTFPIPYWAVIFSSLRSSEDPNGYEKMSAKMMELAEQQPGFLGAESLREQSGFGITISYWKSSESISSWKVNSEHLIAQEFGRETWYESFTTRICRVERDGSFEK